MCPKKTSLEFLLILSIVILCRAEFNLGALKAKESCDLMKAVVKIIKNCHDETWTDAIGIAGNSPDSLITALSSGESSSSVVLLSNIARTIDSEPMTRESRNKLQIFAIVVSSSIKLANILVDVKKSRWWNHMANFYIIDWPISEDGCSRAREILSTAWKMNLPEAKFMCVHATKGLLIYGSNPYTSDAPDPWQLEKIYRNEDDHPWTLLVREYRDDRDLCENMDFDKTIDLGGYEIRGSVHSINRKDYFRFKNDTPVDTRDGYTGHLMKSLFDVTNATVKLLLHDGKLNIKILAETISGTSDIALTGFIMWKMENDLPMIYPYRNGGVFIVTQYRGYKSQLNKLVSVLDWKSRIGLCLVIIVNVIFMKFFLRQNLSTAILDTSRLIFNSCLVKSPITAGSRIYLTSLFVCVITIVGIYQGKMAALLSQQIRMQDIESESDLAKSDLKVYGHHGYEQFLHDRALAERYIGMEGFNCTENVLLEPHSVACLRTFSNAVSEAAAFKLHVSKQPIAIYFATLVMRHDWPMEQRFNSLMQRLVEANLFQYANDRSLAEALRTIDSNRNEGMDENAKVLTLSDLSFAFAILGIGLSAATICFIIETYIDRSVARLRIARIVERYRNQFRRIR